MNLSKLDLVILSVSILLVFVYSTYELSRSHDTIIKFLVIPTNMVACGIVAPTTVMFKELKNKFICLIVYYTNIYIFNMIVSISRFIITNNHISFTILFVLSITQVIGSIYFFKKCSDYDEKIVTEPCQENMDAA